MSQKLIQIVKVVKAVQRKPSEFQTVSFFGRNDFWDYRAIMDDRICSACKKNERPLPYIGVHLRAKWPHLEIEDEDTIRVNEHPNCRCVLIRRLRPTPLRLPIRWKSD